MVKIVKSAKIQVVKFEDLNVGDNILFKNKKREVRLINGLNGFVALDNTVFRTLEGFNKEPLYYKIVECEEVEENEIS